MITNKDRSGYFGASATKYIVGKWNTKTFQNWWLVKLGLKENNFTNKSMLAGTYFEHKIIDAMNIPGIEKDKQIIIGRLIVNLDGNTKSKIYEIKTFKHENGFDLKRHKDYVNQVLVQMYASGIHKAEIDAYGLIASDYDNFFSDIDLSRLQAIEIEYDSNFIDNIYLPRLNYLTNCLEKGRMPMEEELMKCSTCGAEVEELIDTEGKLNGSIGEVCSQCYQDFDIGG